MTGHVNKKPICSIIVPMIAVLLHLLLFVTPFTDLPCWVAKQHNATTLFVMFAQNPAAFNNVSKTNVYDLLV